MSGCGGGYGCVMGRFVCGVWVSLCVGSAYPPSLGPLTVETRSRPKHSFPGFYRSLLATQSAPCCTPARWRKARCTERVLWSTRMAKSTRATSSTASATVLASTLMRMVAASRASGWTTRCTAAASRSTRAATGALLRGLTRDALWRAMEADGLTASLIFLLIAPQV